MNLPMSTPAPERRRTPFNSPLTITAITFTGRQDARLCWSEHYFGANLLIRHGLSEREQLTAIRWAVDTLEHRRHQLGEWSGAVNMNLSPDEPDTAASGRSEGAVLDLDEINPFGRGVPLVECIGCGRDFHPDSSPHDDRCWMCAERFDAESGEL